MLLLLLQLAYVYGSGFFVFFAYFCAFRRPLSFSAQKIVLHRRVVAVVVL